MKKRMMKICYMMTLAAVLCTSGTTGVTGIKSVYAAENEVQERAATTNGVLNLNNGPASITKLEIRDGMIWLILKSGRLFRIGMSQICLMLTDTTPIITHGMM